MSKFPITNNNFNNNAIFMIAWAEFLKLGKITYSLFNLEKAPFTDLKVTQSDVQFVEND